MTDIFEGFPTDRDDGPGRAPAPTGWTDTRPHPWRRLFARRLDSLVMGLLTFAALGLGAHALAADPDPAAVPEGLGQAVVLLSLLLEPVAIPSTALLIGLTGGSLGKWIFGVRVLRAGKPMGFWRALRRELAIWLRGMGLGIPLVSLVTQIVAKSKLEKDGATSWDRAQDLTVTHRPESLAASIGMWITVAILFLVNILLTLLARS